MSHVDLHSHTYESDGTSSPVELVKAAFEAGVTTLAITDHDTFAAIEPASAIAAELDIELITGIELTCKDHGRNVHLLGYFFHKAPTPLFLEWLEQLLAARRDRNCRLASRLQDLGLDVTLEDAERYGRTLTGRPHFARALVEKGHAATVRDAFDRYLGESATAYIEREAPLIAFAIQQIHAAGGITSLAHPIRLADGEPEREEEVIAGFASDGLAAIEAYHTDHSEADVERYVALAEKLGLALSGGSDFHGANKPGAHLGRCVSGTRPVPQSIVQGLRERSRSFLPK